MGVSGSPGERFAAVVAIAFETSGFDVRQNAGRAADEELNASADEIDDRGRAAFVRNVRDVDPCFEFQKLHRKMTRGERAGRAVVQRVGLRFRQRDHVLQRRRTDAGIHGHHTRDDHHQRDRREIALGVVWQVLRDERVDDVRREERADGVTVRGRLRDDFAADGEHAAGPIIDDDLLAPAIRSPSARRSG